MGHERIGYLPKTQKWSAIVADLSSYSSSTTAQIDEISRKTLKNVSYKFEAIAKEPSVQAAFEYLILLTLIPKKTDWRDYLAKKKINISENFSIIEILQNSKDFIDKNQVSKEYSSIAQQSLADAITQWASNIKQGNLFVSHDLNTEIWRQASTGAGFCELSRSFFSNFTERYLKYFLDREAFGKIDNLTDLNSYSANLREHVEKISQFAFETSKITESFAAGWYNKNVKSTSPSHETIKSFVDYSFKKLNSELLIERRGG